MDDSVEEWKPVVGFEGYYEISNWGRVRSLIDSIRCSPGHLLAPGTTKGYHRVVLYRRGKKLSRYVHRLVAEAYIGPAAKGLQVNHKDFNRLNNKAGNLEYMTVQENLKYTRDAGRANGWKRSALERQDVETILGLAQSGLSQRRVARLLGVGVATVNRVVNGTYWLQH